MIRITTKLALVFNEEGIFCETDLTNDIVKTCRDPYRAVPFRSCTFAFKEDLETGDSFLIHNETKEVIYKFKVLNDDNTAIDDRFLYYTPYVEDIENEGEPHILDTETLTIMGGYSEFVKFRPEVSSVHSDDYSTSHILQIKYGNEPLKNLPKIHIEWPTLRHVYLTTNNDGYILLDSPAILTNVEPGKKYTAIQIPCSGQYQVYRLTAIINHTKTAKLF